MAMTPVHCSRRVSFFAGAIDRLFEGSVVWRRSIKSFASINDKSRCDGQLEIDQEQKPGKRIEDKEPWTLSTAAGALQVVERDNGLDSLKAREQGPELRSMLIFGSSRVAVSVA